MSRIVSRLGIVTGDMSVDAYNSEFDRLKPQMTFDFRDYSQSEAPVVFAVAATAPGEFSIVVFGRCKLNVGMCHPPVWEEKGNILLLDAYDDQDKALIALLNQMRIDNVGDE